MKYSSNVNPIISVRENAWVLSIMRDEKSRNSEHAFLLLEGVKDEKAVTHKYDLYMDENREGGYALIVEKNTLKDNDTIRATNGSIEENKTWYGKVVLKYNTEKNGENIVAISWNIDDEQAEALQVSIAADIALNGTDQQIRYKSSGINNISGQSNTGASKKGHSCYTWARDRVNDLGDKDVHLPVLYSDYLIAIPSRSIKK